MIQGPDQNRHDAQAAIPTHAVERASCAPRPFLPRTAGQRSLAVLLALLVVAVAAQIADQLLAPSAFLDQFSRSGADAGSFHSRPIIERDGRRLLWARGDSTNAEWFDVTDSKIDPSRFENGIGKDTIPAINSPQFVDADDPRLLEAAIDDDTVVIGFARNGDARAYPLHILDRHEIVNDTVGGKPVTVGW